VTATLRLTRHANGMVIELRRGQFEIELDGRPIAAIAYSETVEAEIDPRPPRPEDPVGPVLEPRPCL
jgi:hypothetical protein